MLLLDLAQDVLREILTIWLTLKDVTFLDTSYCNNKERTVCLKYMSADKMVYIESDGEIAASNSFVNWMSLRHISIRDLFLSQEDPVSIDLLRKYLALFGSEVQNVTYDAETNDMDIDLISLINSCPNLLSLDIGNYAALLRCSISTLTSIRHPLDVH